MPYRVHTTVSAWKCPSRGLRSWWRGDEPWLSPLPSMLLCYSMSAWRQAAAIIATHDNRKYAHHSLLIPLASILWVVHQCRILWHVSKHVTDTLHLKLLPPVSWLHVQGVGFFESECVSTPTKNCTKIMGSLSHYRNESSMGLVQLRETENTTSWGWTSVGEWLSYTVTVST